MRHFSPQLKKRIVLATGWIVIPLMLFVPLLYFGIRKYNVTGLLNMEGFRFLFHFAAVLLLIWTDLRLHEIMIREKVSVRLLIPLNILILLALSVPYEEGHSFLNTLHIAAAYAASAFFFCLFVCLLKMNRNDLTAFLMTGILCLFLCLTAGKVTGSAEALFGSAASMILSLNATRAY